MLKSVLIIFSGNIYGNFLSMLTGLVVIKMLSVEEYGAYTIIVGFVNILITPISRLFSIAIRRFIPIYRGSSEFGMIKGLLITSTIYVILISSISTLLLVILHEWILSDVLNISLSYRDIFLIYVLGIFLINTPAVVSNALLGYEKFREYTISVSFLPNSGRFIYTLIWWIFLPAKDIGVITGLLAKGGINLISSLHYLKNEIAKLKEVKTKLELRKWILFSLPYSLRFLISYTANNIGVILLGKFHGVTEAGVFRASNFLIMIVQSLTGAFSSATLPKLSMEIHRGTGYENEIVRKASFQNTLITSIMILILIVLGEHLLKFLGNEYVRGFSVLLIMSIMLLLESWSNAWQDYIIARGKTELILLNQTVSSIFSITGSVILVKMFALNGIAVALVLEAFVNFILRYFWLKRLSKSKFIDFRTFLIFSVTLTTIIWKLMQIL